MFSTKSTAIWTCLVFSSYDADKRSLIRGFEPRKQPTKGTEGGTPHRTFLPGSQRGRCLCRLVSSFPRDSPILLSPFSFGLYSNTEISCSAGRWSFFCHFAETVTRSVSRSFSADFSLFFICALESYWRSCFASSDAMSGLSGRYVP
jgi:hypothetical protein